MISADRERMGGTHRSLVDVTLIDAMLALTPEERLRQNDRMLQTIQDLRDAFTAAESHHTTGPAGGERR